MARRFSGSASTAGLGVARGDRARLTPSILGSASPGGNPYFAWARRFDPPGLPRIRRNAARSAEARAAETREVEQHPVGRELGAVVHGHERLEAEASAGRVPGEPRGVLLRL